MTFQPGTVNYTQGFGSAPENVEVPHLDNRAPTAQDVLYPIGKSWIDSTGNAQYVLTSKSSLGGTVTANWQVTASPTGAISTINGLPPSAGNITIAGTAAQIGVSNAGSTVTLSLTGPYTPATYTAHGLLVGEGASSIASVAVGATGTLLAGNTGADPSFTGSPSVSGSITAGTGITSTTGDIVATAGNVSAGAAVTATTTVTGGTGVTATTGNVTATAGAVNAGTSMTATLGNITATNGNFVASTAGTGLSLPVATASGASPQTANARVFSVTFTGVSIASGATQAFDIANTSIVGASTVALVQWSGATAGSALSIVSQVSSAGHLTITMTNGTSATMVTSTADITFTGIVLN